MEVYLKGGCGSWLKSRFWSGNASAAASVRTSCPFGAIEMKDGRPELNAACKVCGICVKNCPEKAILRLETRMDTVDKTKWNDILVFAEVSGGQMHPVSLELIGKARELAESVHFQVKAVLVGHGVSAFAEELLHYGVSEAAVYDDPALGYFRADAWASCVEDYILSPRVPPWFWWAPPAWAGPWLRGFQPGFIPG